MRLFRGNSPKEAAESHDPVAAQSAPPNNPDFTDVDLSQTPNRTLSPSSEKETVISDDFTRNTSFSDAANPEGKITPSPAPSPRLSSGPNEPAKEDKELLTNHGHKTDSTKEKEGGRDVELNESGEEYPRAWKLTLITIALCLCVFCVALDNTIIATAIPRITDEFHSIEDVGWYGSAYLLTTSAVTLTFGKLYTFLSIKWVYLAALFVFELGSLVCATAPNSVALIIGRAIAGIGSAGLVTGSILIISKSVPLSKRPIYTSLVGAMFGVANVAGPLMGGAFTDHLTWRWCFYINLPVGGASWLFVLVFFQSPKIVVVTRGFKEQIKELDLIGTFFFLPAIISLLLALQWGGSKYPWSNGRVIALFVVFGVLILLFCMVQWWAQEKATVPPRIIKNRSVWGAVWFALTLGSAFFVFVYYLPIWFQSVKSASATTSGIMNLPLIIAVVIISVLSGVLVTVCGYYTPFMIASSIIMSIGAGLLTTFKVDSGHSIWIGYQAILGIGIGMGMQQPMIVAQTALKAEDVPVGLAIVIFSQTLGGAIFISVAQNVFQNQLIANLAEYAPSQNAGEVIAAGATMIRSFFHGEVLHSILLAYNDAITQTFYVAVAMSALSIIGSISIEWLSVKGKNIEMTAA
ncbi:uncharacterized protein N7506_008985 [Penicillium brevicompactum]|uniref:uncharacterized protein n=1 Tax=Penicillium brevicompactum TaxID=5074 RepID=UPI0025426476|nr:uncharacterized protein N7506_008985 [Penicillium brevicompactum]KAJ5325883.1 hypothetical protein N7506_008985 [Penicillium brevicompactum]